MPIAKEILDILEIGFKPSKIAKIAKDKCFHCAMDLYYCFRWLLTAPSHRIIALWVHPLPCSDWGVGGVGGLQFKMPQYVCRCVGVGLKTEA